MPTQMQVGPQFVTDNSVVNLRSDNMANLMVGFGAARYQELVRRGYGFHYSQASAGVAVIVPKSGAATSFTIWNPSSSDRWFVPLKVKIGLVSTTAVLGNFAIYAQNNAGDVVGTGAPVVSMTEATPVNALYGANISSHMRFSPAVQNLTAASTFIETLGWSVLANDLAAKSTWNFEADLDGSWIFEPGTIMQIGASTAIASVCVISVFGVEIPEPIGAF